MDNMETQDALSVHGSSPLRLFFVMGAAIFIAEPIIMVLFLYVPTPTPALESVLDAALLSAVILPLLYVYWYRPLMRNIKEHARINAAMRHQALHDLVTPNRYSFEERLQYEIEIARRECASFAVVVLDIKRFKEINGTLGHGNGDELLRQVAARLKEHLRRSDTIACFGADTFGVLLREVDKQQIVYASEKLQSLMEAHFSIEEMPIEIEVRSGIAIFPDHGDNPVTLLQHADIALYHAKQDTEAYVIYTTDDDTEMRRRLTMFGMLRNAIQHNELVLHYQPKIDLTTDRAVGVEALVRWRHPELGIIPPNDFIPLAEQTNLIKPLTYWVIEEAIRQVRAWDAQGVCLNVAVNLSTRNLTDPSLPQRIHELLARGELAVSRMTVEVTESAVITNSQRTTEVLEQLRKMGLALSLDDFGTGYSSLSYLRNFAASELKIDRSFVCGVDTDSSNAAIVRSVIDLAHHLDLKVVAEGVETEATGRILRELNCDMAQGYYYSRPLSGDDLLRWVSTRALQSNGGVDIRLAL
jgi:diguanylate cyclase (GGDEF)-like protein